MSRGGAASSTVARQGRRWKRFRRVPLETPQRVTLTYKGGAEAWVLVEARGTSGIFPGHAYLFDVLREICDGAEHRPPSGDMT